MIKADLVIKLAKETGVERKAVRVVLERFMENVKSSLQSGDNVYLREFGTFFIKQKAEKKARNISKDKETGEYITTTIVVPAHVVPAFKPSKKFIKRVKNNNQI